MNKLKILTNGIIKENPVLVLVLGTCPALAVTNSTINGVGMGLAATFVLICSNVVISLLRKVIPSQVRIAAYIVVIAGFVTIVDLLLQAFAQDIAESLGVFIPLIVVNCIILARAESFASKNKILPAAVDGLCQGIGYTLVLVVMSAIRELVGTGAIGATQFFPAEYSVMMLTLPVGGFLTLGFLIALMQWAQNKAGKGGK